MTVVLGSRLHAALLHIAWPAWGSTFVNMRSQPAPSPDNQSKLRGLFSQQATTLHVTDPNQDLVLWVNAEMSTSLKTERYRIMIMNGIVSGSLSDIEIAKLFIVIINGKIHGYTSS